MIARVVLVALWASVCAWACATGGVREGELPEDPIAFTYRTQEEARRRAEDYQDELERRREAARSRKKKAQPTRGGANDFVASEEQMNDLLAMILGDRTRERDEYQGRLALLHPRSGEVEVVQAARRGSVPLSWSRDRTRLLFAQPVMKGLQIFEYNRVDRTVRGVTTGPRVHTQACYGPEGRIVVAAVDTRQQPLLSFIAVSGPGGRAPFTPLSRGPADHSPVCQPGGEGVAFVRAADGRSQIYYLKGVADREPRRLSPGQHPSFSPDGSWLAFAAPRGRELRIWRIRPDGSGRAPIGRGIRHEARPTVSPDGRLVAYVAAEQPPRRHIYLRRFDGSGDRILFAAGDGEYPVW